ncbi:ABC transporter permease [Rhodoligotrophos defluvii]|uniref:ABC transporter permease n=1 Tax=Rhodoligotrophos defluvii TaxID=2561934 RepID=UPI001960C78B|nr:ABC transporter permease [Rhodoligotrophos defluvii]
MSFTQNTASMPSIVALEGAGAVILQRLLLIAILAAVLSLGTDGFASTENVLNVLRQASLLFIIAAGLTFVIIGGGLDLSIGANLALSACLAAAVVKTTGSVPAAIATALACGSAIGLINGLLITVLRIPPFLATYGVLWIAQGVTYTFMHGQAIYGFPPALRFLGTGYVLGLPVPVVIMLALMALGGAVLAFTSFGRQVYFIGANASAAELSGIPMRARRILLYLLSGASAGFAALVYLGRVNAADAGVGDPLLLPAFAAVLVGGTSLFGGAGGMVQTALGAIILTLVINGLNLFNIGAAWHPLVTGATIILAISIDGLINRPQRD